MAQGVSVLTPRWLVLNPRPVHMRYVVDEVPLVQVILLALLFSPVIIPPVLHKGKAIPLQAWSGPEGSRKLRFPDVMKTAQDGGKVVSLKHRPPLSPGNTPGTHFCQRLCRPQGHSATGRILSLKNSNDTIASPP